MAAWPTLKRLRRYSLIVVDEVGYLPFEQDAANLFFQLVSPRYEHASLILTSNLPFSDWGHVFGDQVVTAAMKFRSLTHLGTSASCGGWRGVLSWPGRGFRAALSARSATVEHHKGGAADTRCPSFGEFSSRAAPLRCPARVS